jgi:putative colanic acid biosynthesis UDP-glucose lipid carrier transferase
MTVLETKVQSGKQSLVLNVSHRVDFRNHLIARKNYLFWKRVFDIAFSSLVIIFLLSWLVPIIAVLIKMSSKGPVFFIQNRVGFLGRSFKCIKFRTMVVNTEANSKQAVQDDPRITKLGYFLRNSNLDELPQFFNVLIGHMSIVGPRPHMHSDCYDFSIVVRNYKFRNITKPGITGLAQVKGYRGPAKDIESIFKRYQWDSFYVRNQGFRLDFRIIGLTIVTTLSGMLSLAFRRKQKQEQPASYQIKPTELLN